MTVKLNLTISEEVVAKSKSYAAKRKTSVSKLVEELLNSQHARFGCELRMDWMSAFQGFLQKNRDGEQVGIVVIDLNSLTPHQ